MFGSKFKLALIVSLLLTACGNNAFNSIADKNSSAAKQEEAQIAINSGDFTTAISIMAEKCPNQTCTTKADAQQYAAAYIGKAGLDVLTVAKNADASQNSTASSSDFAVISKGLPSPTAANLDAIATAIAILKNSKATVGITQLAAAKTATQVCNSYNNEQKDILLELGISQATATILAIGSQLGGFDANGIPADCNGNCSAASAAVGTALNAVYIAPATTYADFAATNLVAAASNLSCAFSTDNTTASAINDLAYSVETHTPGNSATCQQTAPSGYSPVITGAELISYVTTCLN